MSASGGAARGPLSLLLRSAGGQWTLLGAGTVAMFPEKVDNVLGTNVFQKMVASFSDAAAGSAAAVASEVAVPASPIVIHTSSGGSDRDSDKNGLVTTIVKYSVGAVSIWVVYTFASGMMPDWVKEMLPVSRKFFDRAVTNLGKGIINVKDSLMKQILNLGKKQDDLSKQQEETHREVVLVQNELGEARQDLSDLSDAMGRCEGQLESAEKLQLYTSRGVKLLVRCVAGVLPGNDRIIAELLQFTKEGEKYHAGKNNTEGQDAQQEILKLAAARQQQQQLQQHGISSSFGTPQTVVIKPRAMSPEEHHPVTPMLKETMSSSEPTESVENLQELLSLVRDGKIQTEVKH